MLHDASGIIYNRKDKEEVLKMKVLENGTITSPAGFLAAGVACGIKKDIKASDLALIVSEEKCACAGVFTQNLVKGHSLKYTMDIIKDGTAKAILINSGNANACVGGQGDRDAEAIAAAAARALNCSPREVLIGSTGVIGKPLPVEKIVIGIGSAAKKLSENGGHDAAAAIMTTDLIKKEAAVEITISGKPVRIGGIAKGSGMIHPNMATLIGLLTTDISMSKNLLDKALRYSVNKSFNRISVDGDTSVCDMLLLLANGKSGAVIETEGPEYTAFLNALEYVCTKLAVMVVQDGEGATKLIEIGVENAASEEDAFRIALSVAKSPLVKTAFFGEDANWGRILTAAGYAGVSFDPGLVDIFIGDLAVCGKGAAISFDENRASEILRRKEIKVRIDMNSGICRDRVWTCDFSYDYIKINGSYRT